MHFCRAIVSLVVVLLSAWALGSGQTMPTPNPTATAKIPSGQFSIAGVVLDPSDAIVGGATVTLKGGNSVERAGITDAAGTFRFDGLNVGAYDIRVQPPGVKPYKAPARVGPRNSAPLRVTLEIAELRPEIPFDTGYAQVNTEFASNANATQQCRHHPV